MSLVTNTIKQKIKTNLDNSKIVRQLFFNVIFIVTLSDLVSAITSFTDGICASRLINDAASAALAVVSPLLTFTTVIVSIIQIGTQILISKKLAQGDINDAKKAFSTTIMMCIISGLVLAVIVIPMCYWGNILWILGADSASFKYAVWYVIGFFIGTPFFIAYTALFPIDNLVNGKKLSAISVGVVLSVNVIGDIVSGVLFKYGPNAGVVENGKWAMLGIALATIFSFIVGTVILSFVFTSKKSCLKFSLKSLSIKVAGEITLIGLPAGTKIIFIFLRTTIINILFTNAYAWTGMAIYDSCVLFTALSAQSHITPFVESITGGLIAASLSLSSIFYAEEDEDSLDELLKLVIKSTFFVVLGLAVIYALCAGPLVQLYGVGTTTEEDPALAQLMIEQSKIALICDAATIPFVTLGASFLAFFQGTKQTKYAYIVTCLQSLILPLLSLMVFVFCFDFNGSVWVGIAVGFILHTIIHILYAFIYSLVHKNKFRINTRTFFFLPKSFGYTEDQRLKIQIKNINDVNEVSNKVISFCKKHKIDQGRMNNIASCSEELARSIVLSGFTRDRKKNHLCELCISYKKDKNKDIILRLRDDCALYNIEERANHVYVKGDEAANAALKVTYKHAKQVKYSNLLKTNNLVVVM
ncbi:MAG: hypothetical protein MJ199_01725 [Bacilli bacterium]|nr:hypothetical protein [Bacilli bacterium]